MQRQWRVHEKDLFAALVGGDLISVEDFERLMLAMKPVYLKYSRWHFELRADTAEDPARPVNDWIRQVVQGLMTEIALRELELMAAGLRR